MSLVLDAFTILAVLAGAFFFMAGTIGLLRFPDTLTRLHALTKVDNLGLGLIVLGLLPRAGGLFRALELVGVWLLVQLSGAIVAQLVGTAFYQRQDDGISLRDRACGAGPWNRNLDDRCTQ
jgi:multicomponent Na+:H+ antiporter subunit G